MSQTLPKQYRCLLVDPGNPNLDRPKQAYVTGWHSVEVWAACTLTDTRLIRASDQARVEVYEITEILAGNISKEEARRNWIKLKSEGWAG